MKKSIYLIAFMLLSVVAFSQAPQQISYQAVVRNSSNVLLTNTPVGILISITNVRDSAYFSERHTATTNASGLFTIAIGTGTPVISTFAKIDWSKGGYFIKTQIDPTGGTAYTIAGSTQLLSVPYALYAANGSATGKNIGDIQYWDGTKWVILPIGINNSTLTACNGIPRWGPCSVVLPKVLPTVTSVTVNVPMLRVPGFAFGNISSNGGDTIIAKGFCWATTPNPTLSNSSATAVPAAKTVGDTGVYQTYFSGLNSSTTYYTRAYATNSVGTSYGNQLSFSTGNLSGTQYTIGQSYGGGIIFYLDSSQTHGLIAATADQNSGGTIQWYNGTYVTTGATDTTIFGGLPNSSKIVNVQGSGNYAAYSAIQSANGYNDWYLPSLRELRMAYTNLKAKGLGNFVNNYYWTSSETDINKAWAYDFNYNSQFPYYKNNQARVRVIRKF